MPVELALDETRGWSMGVRLSCLCVLFSGSIFLIDPAIAQQDVAIPDPETVEVPILVGGRDPKVVQSGWKNFYFYKPGVIYKEAYLDLFECYKFLPAYGYGNMLPLFVHWNGRQGVDRGQSAFAGSDSLIGGLVSKSLDRRARLSRMRRCMEPRGYKRYPVAEATWEKIIDGYSLKSIAIQAKIAAMGAPDAEPLPESK
ncbi:hypothetical protein K9B35_09855 [Sphingomonas sp. R647]|uniref:hypothetical protein n=1 Tax=Sphingomonas sp. R647 TaxID=2875233 RepID=UPI001CD7C6EC|nr:hypothetical protein [Sphingomonas sp. R647]MCA1198271.1 hypothetical protein [Sphingomonas sp. R647]